MRIYTALLILEAVLGVISFLPVVIKLLTVLGFASLLAVVLVVVLLLLAIV